MSETVLLTGATGFVGVEVLDRLLAGGDDVVAVVRAADEAGAAERVRHALTAMHGHVPAARGSVTAVPGDVTEPALGLRRADFDALAARVTTVVHCAASVSFTLPEDEAERINVAGTAHVLDVARALPRLRRVVHISTAYVAGRHEGLFRETDRDAGQRFRNAYEASKHRAEQLVAQTDDLPVVVVRPSIVVGETDTGWTPAFNVVYWPLQAFARGLLDRVPARPDGIVDIVPVDYVADAILAVVHAAEAEGTYAAVAGDAAVDVAQLVELACAHFGRPAPQFEDDATTVDQAVPYVPYFDVRTRFDDARLAALLGRRAPALRDYFDTLMDYAAATRWGKRSLARDYRDASAAPATATPR